MAGENAVGEERRGFPSFRAQGRCYRPLRLGRPCALAAPRRLQLLVGFKFKLEEAFKLDFSSWLTTQDSSLWPVLLKRRVRRSHFTKWPRGARRPRGEVVTTYTPVSLFVSHGSAQGARRPRRKPESTEAEVRAPGPGKFRAATPQKKKSAGRGRGAGSAHGAAAAGARSHRQYSAGQGVHQLAAAVGSPGVQVSGSWCLGWAVKFWELKLSLSKKKWECPFHHDWIVRFARPCQALVQEQHSRLGALPHTNVGTAISTTNPYMPLPDLGM
jgi:hypothetical protein